MTDLRTAAQQALDDLRDLHANHNITYAGTIAALRAALAQQAEPVASRGWLFRRNADGTIGIFAPPPKPGESQRTSDCVGPNNRDLHELLGKLADHMAAPPQQAEPVPAWKPWKPVEWGRGCQACGIGADGRAYAYVCSRSDCPTKVTCGGVA